MPGQDVECVGRRQRRPEVAQRHGARLHREPEVAESLDGRRGRGRPGRAGSSARELVGRAPVEAARLDHDAAHRRAVSAQELGHGVDDDVGAPLERPAQERRRERVVHDQRDAVLVGDRGERLEVHHQAARVGQALGEDGLARSRSVLAARTPPRRADRRTWQPQPSLGNVWASWVSEPPYRKRDATMWSPGSSRV